jgi:hypothetical protein
VFLNIPFDSEYERFLVALVPTIVAVGRIPRTVLEVPEQGIGRLARLVKHLADCELSVHDLSRVGVPARFNMPFELGLACALAHVRPPHAYVLLERESFRLDRTLSDMRGRDAYIYGRSVKRLIAGLLDALRPTSGARPSHRQVFSLYRNLSVAALGLKRDAGVSAIYSRTMFEDLVAAATDLAARAGILAARTRAA